MDSFRRTIGFSLASSAVPVVVRAGAGGMGFQQLGAVLVGCDSVSGGTPILTYTALKDGPVALRISDINGKLLSFRNFNSNSGNHTIPLDEALAWKPGMYIISLITGDDIAFSKFIKP